MLKDNLKTLIKNKGLSQEELSVKLNVVRQTVSKWEQGLSVPDAEMLISISEVFDTPVSTILGENIDEKEKNNLKVISEKLEAINEQLSMQQKQKRKRTINSLIIIDVCIILFFILLAVLGSPYQNHEALKEIAYKMAEKYGIEFLYRDFRPGFREGQNKARELGLYMQKYCGCVFSEEDRYQKKIEKDKTKNN